MFPVLSFLLIGLFVELYTKSIIFPIVKPTFLTKYFINLKNAKAIFIIFEVSTEVITLLVLPLKISYPVKLVILEITFVSIAIRVNHDTNSIPLIIMKFSEIIGPIFPFLQTITLLFAFLEFTIINRLVVYKQSGILYLLY